jgi:hypothetical protein
MELYAATRLRHLLTLPEYTHIDVPVLLALLTVFATMTFTKCTALFATSTTATAKPM